MKYFFLRIVNFYKMDNIFCKICLQIEFCFPSKFISFFYYFDINIHTKTIKTHETFVINNHFSNFYPISVRNVYKYETIQTIPTHPL